MFCVCGLWRADKSGAGYFASFDGGNIVLAAWMGEATDTLGAIHGALSKSHRNWVACFVSVRVCFRFRLRNSAGGRAGNEVGCVVLLCKYPRRVGVRASVRLLWQGAEGRSRRANRALLGSDVDATYSRPRRGIGGPSAGPQTIFTIVDQLKPSKRMEDHYDA
jgi:hypothetical protein